MSHIRISKHYLSIPLLVLGVAEILLLLATVPVVQELQYRLDILPPVPFSTGMALPIVYALIFSVSSLAMGVYTALMQEGFWSMFFRTLVAYCFLGTLTITLASNFWPELYVGGFNLFCLVMVSTGIMLVARKIFLVIVDFDKLSVKYVVLGSSSYARQLQDDYRLNYKGLSSRIAGFIGSSGDGFEGSDLIQAPEHWPAYCKKNGIQGIIVAQKERRRSEGADFPLDQLLACKMEGIEVLSVQDFYERELHKVDLASLQPSWLLFADGFRLSRLGDTLKRVSDILISLLLSIILMPFLLIVALLVIIETGRPVIYSQMRVGLNGKPFRIYKVRSMTQNAERGGKAVWASANDSRVTRVGSFIRNTRLDEIPQLWNVIKGDMSFVGPRPERPEFVDVLTDQIPFYNCRHTVKPGLMGWAQLNYPYGASVEDARRKLEYDLYYTKNRSVVMDLLIMVQTVEVILLGKGVR